MPYTNPKPKKLISTAGYIFILLLSLAFSSTVFAQGNLLVTPKRVVLEGGKKTEELNLANTGKDSATYVISFIQIRMKDDGTVEKISDPDSGQIFADKYVRFFPRAVTLAPNEAQTVKVQLTRSSDITPGEYRSHLYFRATSQPTPLGDQESKPKDSGISVKLIPIFGISMPVIVRVGESTTQITITDATVQRDSIPSVKFILHRDGNMSAYGDILIEHISPQGKTNQVGIIRGLAVYTPNIKRTLNIPLQKLGTVNYNSGKLRVVYQDQSAKPKKLAEAEVSL